MTTLILTVLSLIEGVIPLLTSSANASAVDSIIKLLEEILPYVVAEVEALAAPVKNIIAALSATPATNAAQAAVLATLDAQVDAAFDAAAAQTDSDSATGA